MEKFKKYIPYIVILLLLVALIISIRSCNTNKINSKYLNHNIEALNDTITYHKMKNGQIYATQLSYISTIDDLKKINKSLYDNVSILNKELSNQNIIAGLNDTVIIKDYVYMDKIIYIDRDTVFDIDYNDQYFKCCIISRYKNKMLYLDTLYYGIRIPIEAYFTDKANIVIKSPNKNVTFSNIQSFIDPSLFNKVTNKRNHISFQLGVGLMPGYDIIHKKLSVTVGPYIGIGLGRSIYSW